MQNVNITSDTAQQRISDSESFEVFSQAINAPFIVQTYNHVDEQVTISP